jgi:altronate dehydratase
MTAAALMRLASEDNVGVAIRAIPAGAEVEVDGIRLVARDAIPFAHKVALRPLRRGEEVIKYGVPIGRATEPIEPGMHVHVHNIRSDYVNNAVDNFEEAVGSGGG